MVSNADAEKGYEAQQYGYDKHAAHTEEPFVHGAATVGAATGRGGDTHRGLKSRHIQFLYVTATSSLPLEVLSEVANMQTEPSVVLLEQVSSLDLARFFPWLVLRHSSWPTWL